MTEADEAKQELHSVLGEAIIRMWSQLPQDIQQRLFEEAVALHGERMRQRLAVFLHGKHVRTHESKRNVPEPDSLGG